MRGTRTAPVTIKLFLMGKYENGKKKLFVLSRGERISDIHRPPPPSSWTLTPREFQRRGVVPAIAAGRPTRIRLSGSFPANFYIPSLLAAALAPPRSRSRSPVLVSGIHRCGRPTISRRVDRTNLRFSRPRSRDAASLGVALTSPEGRRRVYTHSWRFRFHRESFEPPNFPAQLSRRRQLLRRGNLSAPRRNRRRFVCVSHHQ